MSNRITKPFLILSEGKADRVFLKHLLEVRGIDHNFEFFANDKYGAGNTAFEASLKGLPVERGFENVKAILIVTDCDEEPERSFQKIQEQIKEAQFIVPEKPFEIVKTENLPVLVVVMIPFDNVCGNLESYIVRAMADTWGDMSRQAQTGTLTTRLLPIGECVSKQNQQCKV